MKKHLRKVNKSLIPLIVFIALFCNVAIASSQNITTKISIKQQSISLKQVLQLVIFLNRMVKTQ